MPKREDEYWAGEKSELRYCPKHKRYYHKEAGCQLCGWEELERIREGKQAAPQLQKCPECKEESLFWNAFTGLYECLNPNCRRRLTREEFVAKESGAAEIREARRQPTDTDASKARREREGEPRLTRKEQASFSQGGGRAWFRNEYFDAKSKRWRKPKRGFSMKLSLGKISAIFLLIVLVASTICAFTGIAPFSDAKERITEFFNPEPTVAAPLSLSIIPGESQNKLQWTIAEETDLVLIRFSTTGFPNDVTEGTEVCVGNEGDYTHTGLINGVEYYYTIWCGMVVEEETRYSKDSLSASGKPYWIPPFSPTDFNVTAGENENRLSWTPGDRADKVLITCSTAHYPASISEGTQVYFDTGVSYTHTGLTNGLNYYYSVWSVRIVEGEGLFSESSAFASAMPQWILPSTPTNFRVDARHEQNYLTWTLADMNHQALVRFSTIGYPVSSTDGIQAYLGTGTDYLHSDLENGTTYYYSIWAVRDVDEGPLYSEESAHTSGTPEWIGPHGEQEIEVLLIAGADGHRITLANNPDARNPTWSELVSFLQQDETDEQTYDYASFVCADFAEMLHNNAEDAGIIAAYVSLDGTGGLALGHALNAFYTTDRGLVYIDAVAPSGDFPCSADKLVIVQVGTEYVPESIFVCPGYYWLSMGIVTDYEIYW